MGFMHTTQVYTRIEQLAASAVATFQQRIRDIPTPRVSGICGFDGFIDTFIRVVAPADLADFGRRTQAAAGISTSFPALHGADKFGGNGPLLTAALHDLLSGQAEITYIGALGDPEILPIFRDALGSKAKQLFSLANPAHSDCLEFNDGKIMLSDLTTCAEISWARVQERVGMAQLDSLLRDGDFIAAVNWGKLVNVGSVWENLATRLQAIAVPAKKVVFFMDLAEFEQRPNEDRHELVAALKKITAQCRTMLSFNLKEAWQMAELFSNDVPKDKTPSGVLELTCLLKRHLDVDWLIVHPNDGAACATERQAVYIPGPHCRVPLISTGAGDHFGAGVLAAVLRGEDEIGALLSGACTSGFFVRTGRSPSLADINQFLNLWLAGQLPERL